MLKRLEYLKKMGVVAYTTEGKATGGRPRRLVMEPVEFLRRFALLAPPPNRNIVRYYGALGPNAPIRRLVSEEARKQARRLKAVKAVAKACERARGCVSSWAACLSKVFVPNIQNP
ncbi:MAG TPA: hypothetical protein DCL44_09800 [Elusimicrobia bacterium]|nr:hypothetical protein [Elusimicrobiota bacterium]